MEKKTALKISIIGSGRLGSTLACAVDNANSQEVSIVSVSSRTEKTLLAAKELLGNSSKKIFFTQNNFLAAKISNCIFICTPDDEIKKTCSEIFKTSEGFNDKEENKVFSGQPEEPAKGRNNIKHPEEMIVFHFSGSKKLDVLDSAGKAGASVACMHPLKSFASACETAKTLENTLYGVTYDKKDINAKKTIDILSKILKGRTIFVENDKKTLYHACACIASNYLVSLMDFATDAGSEVGLDPRVFLSGLINLSEGTLLNVKKLGTKKALTGPIARGDISTINEHIEIIKSLNRNDIKELYEIMGKKTAKIALENTWISDKTYNELVKILKK
ncbi:MAG: Rossmann-like and DUF2520 domain-containing protein [Candidatus Humimicrobiaceae bacterium]